MTTDDDRVAYLVGEEGSEVDDAARADLDDLKALLADPSVWADPGPQLEDAVVAAIVAEASTAPVGPVVTAPEPISRRGGRRRHLGRSMLTAAAVVAVLALGGFLLTNRDGDGGVTEFSLEPTELFPEAGGRAEISQTESGWRIEIDATGLPRLEDGRFYQAWLRSVDDVLVPVGTFNEPSEVVLWAGASPRIFSTFTITEEEADGDQASSGRRVLVGTIELDP